MSSNGTASETLPPVDVAHVLNQLEVMAELLHAAEAELQRKDEQLDITAGMLSATERELQLKEEQLELTAAMLRQARAASLGEVPLSAPAAAPLPPTASVEPGPSEPSGRLGPLPGESDFWRATEAARHAHAHSIAARAEAHARAERERAAPPRLVPPGAAARAAAASARTAHPAAPPTRAQRHDVQRRGPADDGGGGAPGAPGRGAVAVHAGAGSALTRPVGWQPAAPQLLYATAAPGAAGRGTGLAHLADVSYRANAARGEAQLRGCDTVQSMQPKAAVRTARSVVDYIALRGANPRLPLSHTPFAHEYTGPTPADA